MTAKERKKVIDALKISAPVMAVTQEEFENYIQTLNQIMDWLDQEPCEDTISKQAVNILVDELARAISDERCCVSRGRSTATIIQDILDLPPVTKKTETVTEFADRCRECGKMRTGHWIDIIINEDMSGVRCSKCGFEYPGIGSNFCPDCGAKMVESQERRWQ